MTKKGGSTTNSNRVEKSRIRRPGIHSKCKSSKSKKSKHYKKGYRGQGR